MHGKSVSKQSKYGGDGGGGGGGGSVGSGGCWSSSSSNGTQQNSFSSDEIVEGQYMEVNENGEIHFDDPCINSVMSQDKLLHECCWTFGFFCQKYG